jgi:excisionase family DNA binding protein
MCEIALVSPKIYTTQQAADVVKITRQTLQAWIAKGKLKAPETQLRDGRAVRLWTETDIARLRKVKGEIYLKEMGRPSKNGRK